VTPWLALGEHVIPDPSVRDHHLRYFAHLFQHPTLKINHALLLTGETQGTGKDSWFEPIVRLLGPFAGVITALDLANGFNDYLFERQLLVIEELAEFDNRALANKLKPIFAKPPDTLRINSKGVPQFYVPNVVHGFLMSNEAEPLAIEASDRRFHVYRSPATPKPQEYYEGFYRWLADHLSDVLGFLLRYDLAAFSPYAPPPMTPHKAILIAASEPELDQHLKVILEDLPPLVTLEWLLDRFPGRLRHQTSRHRLAACLKKLGAIEVGRVRLPERRRVWALRELPDYQGLTETALTNAYKKLHFAGLPLPQTAAESA
jgi:Family of unknown function (DUF5906)